MHAVLQTESTQETTLTKDYSLESVAPTLTVEHYINNPCRLYIVPFYDPNDLGFIDDSTDNDSILRFASVSTNVGCPDGSAVNDDQAE